MIPTFDTILDGHLFITLQMEDNPKVLKYIKAGEDPNTLHYTALHLVALNDEWAIADMLREHGANS